MIFLGVTATEVCTCACTLRACKEPSPCSRRISRAASALEASKPRSWKQDLIGTKCPRDLTRSKRFVTKTQQRKSTRATHGTRSQRRHCGVCLGPLTCLCLQATELGGPCSVVCALWAGASRARRGSFTREVFYCIQRFFERRTRATILLLLHHTSIHHT